MPFDLLDDRHRLMLAPGAWLLDGFALDEADQLLAGIAGIAQSAPFRRMEVPGGHRMSVAMTNSGSVGWTSDRSGYRYAPADPISGQPWPPIPEAFLKLARRAGAEAGYDGFLPDSCLVNCYEPGNRLSLHQDRNEYDLSAPIVSVSLGIEASFLWGGRTRHERPRRLLLRHGDVVVWGGAARLRYHGVAALARGHHHATGQRRYNLTFRKAI